MRRLNKFILVVLLTFSFRGSFSESYPVLWTERVGVETKSDGTIRKKSGLGNSWNAGAVSADRLAAGQNGWFEFTVGYIYPHSIQAIGFSDANIDNNVNTIDYALYLRADGNLQMVVSIK